MLLKSASVFVISLFVLFLSGVSSASAFTPIDIGIGSSPSISGNTIVYETGVAPDTILQLFNILTSDITNTGIVGSGPSISGTTVVHETSDGFLKLFDISSLIPEETGVEGQRPAISGNTIVFVAFDGSILKLYDIPTTILTDTTIAEPYNPSISGNIIVYETSDGSILQYNILTTDITDTGIVGGSNPTISGNTIAYELDDGSDIILQLFNIVTSDITNTGIVGHNPSISGNTIVYEFGNGPDTVLQYFVFDSDSDGVYDNNDNCLTTPNTDQADTDFDGVGDACDITPNGDTDDDEVDNLADNCPEVANPDQADGDNDGIGDACDTDNDNDGVADTDDICPDTPSLTPVNADGCPTDTDADGIPDSSDSCPTEPETINGYDDHDGCPDVVPPTDTDHDGKSDGIDNCVDAANADQANIDGDLLGDACDQFPFDPLNDVDGDEIGGDIDNCPDDSNLSQTDTDGDLLGDECDSTPTGESPVISPHADVVAVTNSYGAFVSYDIPTATDAEDGTVPVTCTPGSELPFPVGTFLITCSATDLHNNTVESFFNVIVELDAISPEAYNQFDPVTKNVLVYGTDNRDGNLGPITPIITTKTKWHTSYDDEINHSYDNDPHDEHDGAHDSRHEYTPNTNSEIRTYLITDDAGNSIELTEVVKQKGNQIKVKVLSIQYNDNSIIKPKYATKHFEWSIDKNSSIKELEQKMTVGKHDKQKVKAKYYSKYDQTKMESKYPKLKETLPGIVLLQMHTDKGNLVIKDNRP